MALNVGDRLGHYDLTALIGEGGMGRLSSGFLALVSVLVVASAAPSQPTTMWTEPVTGMQFASVPLGEFVMGSPPGESAADDDDEQQHRVTLTKGFYLGIHEVTKQQFAQFVAETDYTTEAEVAGFSYAVDHGEFVQRPLTWQDSPWNDGPVVHVTWHDATAFTQWLSRLGAHTFRLPTEAEWEYAARAGTAGPFPGEPESIAWHRGNSGGALHPGGGKAANAWGLHDVIGNALEWVGDWYGEYPLAPVADPQGPASGEFKVIRSGTFLSDLTQQAGRVADRHEATPSTSSELLSFRIVREGS